MLYSQEKKKRNQCYSQLIHHPHPYHLPLPRCLLSALATLFSTASEFPSSSVSSNILFVFSLQPGGLLFSGLLSAAMLLHIARYFFVAPLTDKPGESPLSCGPHSAQNKKAEGGPLECAGVLELLFGLVLCEGCRFSLLSHTKACQRSPCLQFPPSLWWTWASTSPTTS